MLDGELLKSRAFNRVMELDAYVVAYIKYYNGLLDDAANPSLSPNMTWTNLLQKVLPPRPAT